MAAAASPLRNDYVADWLDEIEGMADVRASFSSVARAAIVAVIDSFAAEDGFLPRAGWRARMMLATTPAESGRTTLSRPADVPRRSR